MSYSVVFVYVRMCCTESKCIPSTEKVFDKTQKYPVKLLLGI